MKEFDKTSVIAAITSVFENNGFSSCAIEETHYGPTYNQYVVKLGESLRKSKLSKIKKELSHSVGERSIRLVWKSQNPNVVKVEIERVNHEIVDFRKVYEELKKQESYNSAALPLILGRDHDGKPVFLDITRFFHILVGGKAETETRSFIIGLIASIAMRKNSEYVKFLVAESRAAGLSSFNGLPHLIRPVINTSEDILKAFSYVEEELIRRYSLFSESLCRNISGYNEKIEKNELPNSSKLPYIIFIIDGYQNFIRGNQKDFERAVNSLLTKARPAGIHFVFNTNDLSTDVITGTMKSNCVTRIAFATASEFESCVLLDEVGAESLVGDGDMLLYDPYSLELVRLQGACLSENEISSAQSLIDDEKIDFVAKKILSEHKKAFLELAK